MWTSESNLLLVVSPRGVVSEKEHLEQNQNCGHLDCFGSRGRVSFISLDALSFWSFRKQPGTFLRKVINSSSS